MTHRFYTSALRMFVFSAQFAALMALFGVGIMVIRWIDGVLEPEHVYNFFLYVGFAPLILFLLLVVAGYIWRITITPDTLRCPTKYGRYYTVSWASIRSVAPEAQVGFSYLRITSSDADLELWLPTFLGRQNEFEKLVASYAGPDNPLTQWFERAKSVDANG